MVHSGARGARGARHKFGRDKSLSGCIIGKSSTGKNQIHALIFFKSFILQNHIHLVDVPESGGRASMPGDASAGPLRQPGQCHTPPIQPKYHPQETKQKRSAPAAGIITTTTTGCLSTATTNHPCTKLQRARPASLLECVLSRCRDPSTLIRKMRADRRLSVGCLLLSSH